MNIIGFRFGRVVACYLLAPIGLFGGDVNSAGKATVTATGKNAFKLVIPGLSKELRREFFSGNSFFQENWIIAPASAEARDGVGPLFNSRSCSSCHMDDGRGAPPAGPDEIMTGMLIRLSVPGSSEEGHPLGDPIYGSQLAVRAIPCAEPEAAAIVTWITQYFTYADGEVIALRKPTIELKNWRYGEPSKDLMTSARVGQPIFGSGLLEAIDALTINALADPDDSNHDGISGRENRVWNAETKQMSQGRFGWKASQPSLRQQVAVAFLADMGLTSSLNPDGEFTKAQSFRLSVFPNGGTPEVADKNFEKVVTYVRTLAVPARRDVHDPSVQRGEKLMDVLQCTACHTAEIKTGERHPIKELHGIKLHAFTDLLLHEMGPDLADGRPDFVATGTEWRTQPLWGLGLHGAVNGNDFYLHDGRARTHEEAILWHGGESKKSRDDFAALTKAERADLLRFLKSL